MNAVPRPYRDDQDYWRIRGFLREASLLNGRHDFCWSLLRWDYWRWHIHENIHHFDLEAAVTLWEADGNITAMLNPDSPGEAFFQVHRAQRAGAPLEEMLDLAEARLSVQREGGGRELIVWVLAGDERTRSLLGNRGYGRSKFKAEHMRRRSLEEPLPEIPPRDGYSVRSLDGPQELPARSWLSWKVFHPDEPDEKYGGWDWYLNVQRVPLYRRDLDLVAVSADGELAAFCTVWFDDVTRTAVFEPVGTHPAHQKRGLGRVVMAEGLRRARHLGATLATVSSYGDAAHRLYESMGFRDFDLLEPWIREWS